VQKPLLESQFTEGDGSLLTAGVVPCVDLLQVRIVGNAFDPLLERKDSIVASHHGDGTELESLREVHRADSHMACGR
jgi:hypothetical protein